MNELTEKATQLEATLDSMLRLSYINLQPYANHINWPVGETRDIDGSISTKIAQDIDHMIFKVAIPPGVSFQIHHHDMVEHCIVIRGVLADDMQPGKVWKATEVCTYSIGRSHTPRNAGKDTLVLQVVFHNPRSTQP